MACVITKRNLEGLGKKKRARASYLTIIFRHSKINIIELGWLEPYLYIDSYILILSVGTDIIKQSPYIRSIFSSRSILWWACPLSASSYWQRTGPCRSASKVMPRHPQHILLLTCEVLPMLLPLDTLLAMDLYLEVDLALLTSGWERLKKTLLMWTLTLPSLTCFTTLME